MIKPIKKNVSLKVPVRADIAGAFSDIPYYLQKYQIERGEVVNIALPVYLNIQAEIGRETDPITIETPDLNEKIVGDLVDLKAQEKNNVSQVALNFIRLFSLDSAGLKIIVDSGGKIPVASGLGTSSAVGVGVVMALSELYGLSGINAPEFNYLVEQSMGVVGGKQDHYASFLQGVNYLSFSGPQKSIVTLIHNFDNKSPEYKWLSERIIVYFSGQSRSSGLANAKPDEAIAKNPSLLLQIAAVAKPVYEAIKTMNEEALKRAIAMDRKNRLKLSKEYYTDTLWQMAKDAEKLGFAHRACGAGAGGCLLFFGDPGKKKELISKLEKIGGKLVY